MFRCKEPSSEEEEDMDDSIKKEATSFLKEIAKGNGRSELEILIFEGLELIHLGKGIVRCKLVVSDRVAGEDGTWQAGAIAAVMDAIGAVAVYSYGDGLYLSVDFNSSFYSTAKIQEKVEVEARVNGSNGGLKSTVIEVRRENKGEIIAIGRLWMAPLKLKTKPNAVSPLSKL